MADFQSNLTEPSAPAAPAGKQSQFTAPAAAAPAAQALVGLAGILDAALPAFAKMAREDDISGHLETINEYKNNFQVMADQGLISEPMRRVLTDKAIRDYGNTITDARQADAYQAAWAYSDGRPGKIEEAQQAQAANALTAGFALDPTSTIEKATERGTGIIAAKAESELYTIRHTQRMAAMDEKIKRGNLEESELKRMNREMQASASDLGGSFFKILNQAVDPVLSTINKNFRDGDVEAGAKNMEHAANVARLVEQTKVRFGTLAMQIPDPGERDKAVKSFNDQADQMISVLTKSAANEQDSKALKLLMDRAGLGFTEAAPQFTLLKALTGGGAALDGAVNSLLLGEGGLQTTLSQELNSAFQQLTANGPLGEAKKLNLRIWSQSKLQPNIPVSAGDAAMVFKGHVKVLDSILKSQSPVHEMDSMNFAKSTVAAANIALRHGTSYENVLAVPPSFFSGQREGQLMADLALKEPLVAAQVNRKIMAVAAKGIRLGLQSSTDVGQGEGFAPGSGGLDIPGVALHMAYDPGSGRFLTVDIGGRPADILKANPSEAERLAKLNTMINDNLDVVVEHKRYDPALKGLSDLQVRNLFMETISGTVNTQHPLLVSGASFPVEEISPDARRSTRGLDRDDAMASEFVKFKTDRALENLLGITASALDQNFQAKLGPTAPAPAAKAPAGPEPKIVKKFIFKDGKLTPVQ